MEPVTKEQLAIATKMAQNKIDEYETKYIVSRIKDAQIGIQDYKASLKRAEDELANFLARLEDGTYEFPREIYRDQPYR